ncbi:aspartyl aminopeptidase [Exidia glandulosa HHB12029]|uniref:aspartyl aminopeptidase n=1 Tax=Exidia glandulosa HHB12029 TaxID=1314781 RepID=A0A165QVJ3_EXIGL|nr:aspartyl aminopeptidase [Exidia glandulosa HHB12029]
MSATNKLVNFLTASPTPFHAVHNAAKILEAAGFKKLSEAVEWDLKPGGRYYFTRQQSALLAFTTPTNFKPGTGVSVVATHIDSPNLRVRPVSARTKEGFLQVAVETYGGGLWHTWWDRDLSVAGRVVVSDGHSGFVSKLVRVDKPLLRVSSLAIHLDRDQNANFKPNLETHMVPVLGLASASLNKPASECIGAEKNHHPGLVALLAQEASVQPDKIHDLELCLFDVQPPTIGGLNDEFVFSPRLDNQFSSFCAVEALAASTPGEGNVNCIALFNHEEIGSQSTTGAQSDLVKTLVERLSKTAESTAQAIARSFIISSDMGHSVHPSHKDKHQEEHKPIINGGIVIKTNANQRYATDSIGQFVIKQLVQRRGGKVQDFETRNDMPCGSTVGPMLSTIGIRTVDVGCAMLSMHSVREQAGTQDVQAMLDLFSEFFESFSTLDQSLRFE